MQVHRLEALEHLEEQTRLVELADRVVEVKALEHVAHVLAEAGDVVAQVRRQLGRVGAQLVEVVARGVVEGEARGPAELPIEVLQPSAAQLLLPVEHLFLGWGQHTVEAAQDGQWEDHVLVLAALEGVADEVRDPPQEADDLAMVHGRQPVSLTDGRRVADRLGQDGRPGKPNSCARSFMRDTGRCHRSTVGRGPAPLV
jgi:hypothetical protein